MKSKIHIFLVPVILALMVHLSAGANAANITKVTAVNCTSNDFHTLFLTEDGTLWGIGTNGFGQLGDGTIMDKTTPVQIATGVIDMAVGARHSFFIKNDGSLWAMGHNYYGQLGDGTNTDRLIPVQVAVGVSAVAAGLMHSLFVKNDGTLWVMGQNSVGQLGDGTADRSSPAQVATDVKAVAAGGHDSLFVKTDGTLWAMGSNSSGQLGDGTTSGRSRPVQVASGVRAVSAGINHSMFVKSDGTLWGMGSNSSGQLGDGTTTNRLTPVQVASGVSAVSVGYNHSLFVKSDGTLWGMGENGSGQLGDNASTNQGTPVQIVGNDLSGNSIPVIAAQPVSQTINTGLNAALIVSATGSPAPDYQWQSSPSGSGTWTDLANIVPYGGVTTGTLTITAVTAALNGTRYHCVIANAAGSVTSSIVKLTVNSPPAITAQPASQTVTAGANAVFAISATGPPAPNYQWQFSTSGSSAWTNIDNTEPYSGVTTATLTITAVTTALNGTRYHCVATNTAGTATSDAVTLTVSAALVTPVITTQPASQNIIEGQNTAFTIAATGNPTPTCQWQSSPNGSTWTNISEANSTTLTLNAVTLSMSGMQYRCVTTNSQGNANSNAAILTVTPNPTTLAQTLKNQLEAPGTATVTVTGNVDLSLVGGAILTSGKTIVGADATSTITGGLTIPTGVSGVVVLGVNFSGDTLVINGATDVEITHCTFTNTPVTITGGADNITFSWNEFTATSGGGSAMTISNAGAGTGILLHNNLWGDGLKTNMPAATNARVYMFNNYFAASGNTTATVAGAGAQILSVNNIYQGVKNPLAKQSGGLIRAIGNFASANTGSNTGATGDDTVFVPAYSHVMQPAGIGTPLSATVLANLITTYAGNTGGKTSVTPASTNGSAAISATVTGNGASKTSVSAHVPAAGGFTLTANASGFTPASRQWYRNNFAITGATSGTYTITNANANTHAGAYAVALTTSGGEIVNSGAFTVTVGALAAPAITTQPVSKTINAGGSATFTVVATGDSLTYQWRKGGVNISGANSASYTITNAQQSHNGSYAVVVANASGTVTSNAATLTVNASGTGGNNGSDNSGGGGGGGALGWPAMVLIAAMLVWRSRRRHGAV